MKVLLPNSVPLATLPRPDTRFVVIDIDKPVPEEHVDAEVLVVWGQPRWVLKDAAARMTRLRLVQALAAGPDDVVTAGFAPGVAICSGVGLHDGPVAEHALALTLALVRSVPALVRAQMEHRWAAEYGWAPASAASADSFVSLSGRNVLVWGFGSIGRHLAPMLTALGATVTGVARTAGQRDGYPVLGASNVDAALPGTDVVVMILPHSPDTFHAMDARRLALLPAHARLVNVGRGSTVDTDALIAALRAGSLGGAALDVFEQEPLPPTSPLWDLPQVLLSPHAAGGRPTGVPQLLDRQLMALEASSPLANLLHAPR